MFAARYSLGGQCLTLPSPWGMLIWDLATPPALPLPNHKVLTPTSCVLGTEARLAGVHRVHQRVHHRRPQFSKVPRFLLPLAYISVVEGVVGEHVTQFFCALGP